MLRFDENGALYFACTKCYTITRIHGVNKYIKNWNFKNADSHGEDVKLYIPMTPILHECPLCHNSVNENGEIFNVDPDIAEEILMLNLKGYRTYASCSSHCDVDGYIWEKDNYIQVIIDLPSRYIEKSKLSPGIYNILPEHYHMIDGETWGRCNILWDISIQRKSYINELRMADEKCYIPYYIWVKEYEIALNKFSKWVNDLPDRIQSDDDITIIDIDVTEKEHSDIWVHI